MGSLFSEWFPQTQNPRDLQQAIQTLEDTIKSQPGIEIQIPTRQYWCNGVYLREMTLPPGVLIVGKTHRYNCLNIVFGNVEVANFDGCMHIIGHKTYESPADTKRAIFSHAETVWTTAHPHDPQTAQTETAMESVLIKPDIVQTLQSPQLRDDNHGR